LQAEQVSQGVLIDHLPMLRAAAPGGLLDIGADDEPCDPRAIASGRPRSRRANHAHSAVRGRKRLVSIGAGQSLGGC
jgi:hypothetical protein